MVYVVCVVYVCDMYVVCVVCMCGVWCVVYVNGVCDLCVSGLYVWCLVYMLVW